MPFEITVSMKARITCAVISLLLAFAPAAQAARAWNGAVNSDWFVAGNWDGGLTYPQAGDSVLVSSGSILLTNATDELTSFTITNATMTFSNWMTSLRATTVTVQGLGILTHAACNTNLTGLTSNRVYILCTNMTVAAGGKIDANGKGYAPERGPGGVPGDCSGAGYGGRGGYRDSSYIPGNPYGFIATPIHPGSGAQAAGGGVVRIDASGSVTVDGVITADGFAGNGGGSGGSVYITCRDFSGSTGTIRAVGGTTSTHGCGGGGRIAVAYDADSQKAVLPKPTVIFSVEGGRYPTYTFGDSHNGLVGTLYFTDVALLLPVITNIWANLFVGAACTNWNTESLTISNSYLFFPTNIAVTVASDLTAVNAGRMYLVSTNGAGRLSVGGNVSIISTSVVDYAFAAGYQETLTVGGNLVMTNSAQLHLRSGPTNASTVKYGGLLNLAGRDLTLPANCTLYVYSDATNGGSMKMVVRDLTVAAGGTLNADASGFGVGYGPGKGFLDQGGGGYGGRGGCRYSGDGSGPTYGSSNAPTDPGSPGQNYGSGGGVVRVDASGNVTVNGTITANGPPGGESTGSGGAIFITSGSTFGGGAGGIIQASGGSTWGGGGGGGRIAVWIGVSEGARSNYLAGTPGKVIMSLAPPTNNYPGAVLYSGMTYVSNGIAAFYGDPGTALFFSWPHVQGSVVRIR